MNHTEQQEIHQRLMETDLFIDWDPALVALIAGISQRRSFRAGEMLFDENSTSSELYFIDAGQVEIRVRPGIVAGKDHATGELYQPIATLRRGQNFGEIALVDEGRRSAAAFCIEPNTRLIIVPRQALIQLCEDTPRLGYQLMHSLAVDLANKIRNTDLEIRAYLLWSPAQHPD